MVIYTVQQGDSVYSIGRRFGISPEKIIADNAILNPQRLMIGQALVLMVQSVKHTVKSGETLYTIAQRYQTSVEAILSNNPDIAPPYTIYPGQVINISTPDQKYGTITVNGFAFPTINQTTLERTLPNLTYISIFSYQVKPDGSLTDIPDENIIRTARAKKVGPLLVLTNLDEEGFNTELAHTILTNQSVQTTLINNVLSKLQRGYVGVNVDFEYIRPTDKEAYNSFITRLTNELAAQGYIVTSSLAPKTSSDQPGLLYEAHDYRHHGQTVDYVILMTYEWGYTFGPPMAVAPVNEVKKVLNYAVSAIPSNKILMGIPNYGYDWTLPFVKGNAARSLSNTAAINLASNVGAKINFDQTAMTPYFNYYDNQRNQHVVWFEDPRSIQAKLNLVRDYKLGGVSYWTVNSYFPQNWLILQSMFNVRRVL